MSTKKNTTIVLVSLTDTGKQLAESIARRITQSVVHLYKPDNFSKQIQSHFQQGHPMLFVCATGIVIRALASVIRDKQTDPPVLVLDEKGKYVIPLLSGHEGGANQWATEVAELMGAQAVITSANDYTKFRVENNFPTKKIALGMGCSRGCSVNILRELVLEIFEKNNLSTDDIVAICSIDVKQDETGLIALAKELRVPFVVYPAKQLRTVEDRLSEKSQRVFDEVGCYGVAEGACLVFADKQLADKHLNGKSILYLNKIKNQQATLALTFIS